MKLLLVNIGGTRPVNPNKGMRPLSLMYLASYLKKMGFEANILDLSCLGKASRSYLEDYLRKWKPEVLGFGCYGPHERFYIFDSIQFAARVLPEAKVIVGGAMFTFTAEEALKHLPEIDVVVRGEGEITVHELMQHFFGDKKLSEIDGITYRDGDAIRSTPDRELSSDLDAFAIDDAIYDCIDYPGGSYVNMFHMRNYEHDCKESIFISVGRGCPGQCVFCSAHRKKYRTRSVDSIINEIKYKQKKYNCNWFLLDDPFLAKREPFVREFCRRLKDENLDIKWYMETKASISADLIRTAAAAGCVSMDIGLESASNKTLRSLKKGITVEQAQRTIDSCRDSGIRIKCFLTYSCPGETLDDALETLAFVEKNNQYLWNTAASRLFIAPGAELEQMAKDRGMIPQDFSWYDRSYQGGEDREPSVPIWRECLSDDEADTLVRASTLPNNVIEWDRFMAGTRWDPSSRVALYTASGATREFLEEYGQLEHKPFRLVCAFDREKTGTIGGLPILRLSAESRDLFDKIIITSREYCYEIKRELTALGLTEGEDFNLVYFSPARRLRKSARPHPAGATSLAAGRAC